MEYLTDSRDLLLDRHLLVAEVGGARRVQCAVLTVTGLLIAEIGLA